jgi:hypothetical protein
VHTLRDFLNQLAVERRNIRWLPARHNALVHDDFLIDPLRAGIDEIDFDGGL